MVTLLFGSDEVFSPVNSDQVLSDVDFPPGPVSHNMRQVVCRRDASPDVLLVDALPVRRPGDPRRFPRVNACRGEVSMTISPVPASLDMTVTCASGVVPMSTQPPAVTPVPAMSKATVTSRDVYFGRGEGAGCGALFYAEVGAYYSGPDGGWCASRPLVCSSELSHSVFFVDVVRPVGHSFHLDVGLGDVGDSSVPLSPNRVQAGCSQDVPEEGSIFHVSPVLPGFLTRPSQDDPQFPLDEVLLPSTIDDFSDSDLGAPITYAQCELIPGSDTPMPLPVFSVPSGFSARLDQSSIQTVLALGTSSHPYGGIPCHRSSHGYGGRPVAGDGPTGLSVSIHAVQRTAVRGWESGIWLTASSPTVPGVCRCSGVGSPLVPLTNVLG